MVTILRLPSANARDKVVQSAAYYRQVFRAATDPLAQADVLTLICQDAAPRQALIEENVRRAMSYVHVQNPRHQDVGAELSRKLQAGFEKATESFARRDISHDAIRRQWQRAVTLAVVDCATLASGAPGFVKALSHMRMPD
jgi:hypothetical protein